MWIKLIIIQVLLYQACQGQLNWNALRWNTTFLYNFLAGNTQTEDIGIQTINVQKAGCKPLDKKLTKYRCSRLAGEVDLSNSIWKIPQNIEHLTIDDSANLTMDLATLTTFTKLTQLSFQDSQVSELKLNGTTGPEQISVLKFIRSWSRCPEVVSIMSYGCKPQLLDLNTKVIYSLRGLKEMHIINCTLARLTEPELPIILNITGGSINCLVPDHEKLPPDERLVDFLWIGDLIKNKNATLSDDVMCYLNILHYNPLYSINRLSFKENIEVKQETMENCPSKCKCNLVAVTLTAINPDTIKPKVEVNCNNISLVNLPSIMPKYTTNFLASHNNLTEIDKIFENDVYMKINKFMLSHNQIREIDGEKFYNYLAKRILDFSIDLSHNEITEFPVSKLSMAYECEKMPFYLKISKNPLNCKKCDFLVDFQKFLDSCEYAFWDRSEIRCSESSGDLQPVLSLDVNTLCPSDEPI